jgi:hypothetical protein
MNPPLRLFFVVPLAMALLLVSAPGNVLCSPNPDSPLSVLAAFEEAWAEGQSKLVEQTLASDKIALSLSDAGPQDEAYTRTQAAYLIKDALAYRITESFGFVEFQWSEKEAKLPHGLARWVYKRREGGPSHEMMLKVSLRKEGATWAVAEIRLQSDR